MSKFLTYVYVRRTYLVASYIITHARPLDSPSPVPPLPHVLRISVRFSNRRRFQDRHRPQLAPRLRAAEGRTECRFRVSTLSPPPLLSPPPPFLLAGANAVGGVPPLPPFSPLGIEKCLKSPLLPLRDHLAGGGKGGASLLDSPGSPSLEKVSGVKTALDLGDGLATEGREPLSFLSCLVPAYLPPGWMDAASASVGRSVASPTGCLMGRGESGGEGKLPQKQTRLFLGGSVQPGVLTTPTVDIAHKSGMISVPYLWC